MEFEAVPRGEWYRLFADLAALEECFVVGSALGAVHEHPFMFDLVEPKGPVRSKPIIYPPKARKWLREYLRE